MNPPSVAEPQANGGAGGHEQKSPRTFGDLQKTITMAQIAKAAGVSQGAISSLLNDRDYGIRVSEKTRERVFKVCRDMGYIPNDLRAVVRMYPELGEFCLLISDRVEGGLSDPFIARLAHAAMCAIPERARSLALTLYSTSQDYLNDVEQLPHPIRSGVASKFFSVGSPNSTLVQTITRRGLPFACIGQEVAQPGVISFLPDYVQASRLAIAHLHQLGHRRIGIVSGPFGAAAPHILELNRGVQLACEELGMKLDAQNIVYGDLTFEAGHSALATFRQRAPGPTAIFSMSDAAAAGLIAACCEAHLQVPEELSIVGCSDNPGAQLTSPALTTVHLPAEEMAALAVREIDRLVQEGAPREPRKVIVPVRLIERKSSAAAPAAS
jgi:LacI family transcriptional regulator